MRMKAMFACLSGSPPAENGPIRTDYVAYNDVSARGCSSAGRALESHSRGQGFESPQLHRPDFLEHSRAPRRECERQSRHSSASRIQYVGAEAGQSLLPRSALLQIAVSIRSAALGSQAVEFACAGQAISRIVRGSSSTRRTMRPMPPGFDPQVWTDLEE